MDGREDVPVALVTGASRGIGKAVAVALAGAGYRVAITARSQQEGEEREHSSTVAASDTSPLPGSLATTSSLIESAGAPVLAVPSDLLDIGSLTRLVETVLARWGRIDVLVNNARYVGPGHMDRFLDTPLHVIGDHLAANAVAPMHLVQLVLPGMVARGTGSIVNLTSAAGTAAPPAPAGQGGWGMGYAVSKAAIQRVNGVLAVEYRDEGIRFFNLGPGGVATERIRADMAGFGFDASRWAPPELIGAVVAWLVTADEAEALSGTDVQAQELALERGLYPEWARTWT